LGDDYHPETDNNTHNFYTFPIHLRLKLSRDGKRVERARIEIKHNEFIRDKNTETFSGHLRNKAEILKQIHSTLVLHVAHAEKLLYCGQGAKTPLNSTLPAFLLSSRTNLHWQTPDARAV
jgi:hypothetical protein